MENEAREGPPDSTSEAWDRIGQFLEGTATLGERMVDRNLKLWSSVRAHLRQGPYSADAMAADTARALAVFQENVEDAWAVLTSPPQREPLVQTLPTAFLFFDREDSRTHRLLPPVFVPVTVTDDRELPEQAEIALDGTSSESDPRPSDESAAGGPSEGRGGGSQRGDDASRRGVEALLGRLVARRDGKARYRLEVVGNGDAHDLVAGVYDGLIYLRNPALPLANVRVVVEGPPPAV